MLEQIKNKVANKDFQKKVIGVVVVTGTIVIAAVIMHHTKEVLNEKLYGGQLELGLNWNKSQE